MITHVSVTTDKLLAEQSDEERIHDVVLIVHAKTLIVDHMKYRSHFNNSAFG